jgi:hypothetical protein
MSSPSSSSRAAWIIGALVTSIAAVGCSPSQTCPAVTTAAGPRAGEQARAVYRFDFGLTTSDGTGAPPVASSFTLNLMEHDKGEVHVGKNVALTTSTATSASGGQAPVTSARQDVGLKVAAHFYMAGDEPLLDVALEMSSFDPPSNAIRKVVVKSDVLAFTGKPAVVTSLDDDHKRYQLTVTATRVR